MAKSTPRPGRGLPARAAAKSKMKSAAADAGPADDKPGMPVEIGMAIFTTIALIGALVCLDMIHATYGGHGMIFKP